MPVRKVLVNLFDSVMRTEGFGGGGSKRVISPGQIYGAAKSLLLDLFKNLNKRF